MVATRFREGLSYPLPPPHPQHLRPGTHLGNPKYYAWGNVKCSGDLWLVCARAQQGAERVRPIAETWTKESQRIRSCSERWVGSKTAGLPSSVWQTLDLETEPHGQLGTPIQTGRWGMQPRAAEGSAPEPGWYAPLRTYSLPGEGRTGWAWRSHW